MFGSTIGGKLRQRKRNNGGNYGNCDLRKGGRDDEGQGREQDGGEGGRGREKDGGASGSIRIGEGGGRRLMEGREERGLGGNREISELGGREGGKEEMEEKER